MDSKYQYVKRNTQLLEIIISVLTILSLFYNIYIIFRETYGFTDFSVNQGVLIFELISVVVLLLLSFIVIIITVIGKIRGLSSIVIFLIPISKEIMGSVFYWRRGNVTELESVLIPIVVTIILCLINIILFICYMNIEKIAKSLKPITTICLFLGIPDMIWAWVATDLGWHSVFGLIVSICVLIGFEIALSFCAYKTIEICNKVTVRSNDEIVKTIKEYKELLDLEVINQEEFDEIKKELLKNKG